MRYTRFILLFCLVSAATAQAQVRKYSNEFLSVGVGAKALALSNATVATTDDVTAGYWNPAGLTGVRSNMELGLMHSEYFAGIAKYDYGAIALPVDSFSTIGLSMLRFGVDNIPNTIDLVQPDGSFDYDKIKSFSAADYAFLFSYARKSKIEGLSYGANVKVIHRIVGSFAQAWGFGLDAGVQYRHKQWAFGAMGRDITGTFNSWSYSLDDKTKQVFALTQNEIPVTSNEVTLPKLILAASYTYIYNANITIRPELDADLTFDGMRNVLIKSDPLSIDPHLGVEVGFKDMVFLRGGVFNIQQIHDFNGNRIYTVQPNFGVGLKFKNISLDYALANIGSQSGIPYSNVFSLKLDFYKKKKYHFE